MWGCGAVCAPLAVASRIVHAMDITTRWAAASDMGRPTRQTENTTHGCMRTSTKAPWETVWPHGRMRGRLGPSSSYGSSDTGQQGKFMCACLPPRPERVRQACVSGMQLGYARLRKCCIATSSVEGSHCACVTARCVRHAPPCSSCRIVINAS